MSTDPMKVTLHEQNYIGAPDSRETIYRQGEPSQGGGYGTYRISVAEGREWAHHTLIHFVQAKPNAQDFGVTNENLIAIVIDRLECFQKGPFPCAEADEALDHLRKGLDALKSRAKRRYLNGTVGKHEEVPYTPVAPIPVEVPAVSGDVDTSSAETSGEGDKQPANEKDEGSEVPATGAQPGSASADAGSPAVVETPRRRGQTQPK